MGVIQQQSDTATNGGSNGSTNGANASIGKDGARTIKSWAPATGELLGEVRVSTKDEVHAAVARAQGPAGLGRLADRGALRASPPPA